MSDSQSAFDFLGYQVSVSVTDIDDGRWNYTYIINVVIWIYSNGVSPLPTGGSRGGVGQRGRATGSPAARQA